MLTANETSNVVINGKEYDTFTEPPVALAQERANTSFPVREMTYFLDGSKETTELFENMMNNLERDPLFSNDDFYDLTKEEIRETTIQRVAAMAKYVASDDPDILVKRFSILNSLDGNTGTRSSVHFGLFFNAIQGQGTTAQLKYWTNKGAKELKRFYGCFSMTEMGHGSNVAGLETTAVFDKKTDEFVINTPHIAATKWWIGGAAHTATHTVCFARLKVEGKDYGVKSFVVPLRNVNDHSLKPGISLGDIGKKMGRDGIDNGWIQFTNVRIPRQYLLMRYTQVDREGVVTQPPLAQLAYGALVGGRVSMCGDSFQTSKRFLTIALRYAAIRRQFSSTPGEPETKLLDYTYHQRRLIPRLAYTYAMRAAGVELYTFSREANQRLLAASESKDKAALAAAIEDAKELFTVSAGLKAFLTWATAENIDECRQACGGHGYSGYNGFGQGYNDWVVQCTWEGDNNILTLSTGRSLIQSGLNARQGKRLGNAVEYLSRAKELNSVKLNGRDITDPAVQIEAWEAAAARGITRAVDAYLYLTKEKGLTATQAYEELSQQRFEIARLHTRQYVIKCFYRAIDKAVDSIKPVLLELASLFSLWSIEREATSFLTSGYLATDDVAKVTDLVNELNKRIRVNAIGLTDAFNLSDFFINSPIGSYDGNAYRHYYDKVVRRNPHRNTKAPYHDTKIKPFLQRLDDEIDVSELSEIDIE